MELFGIIFTIRDFILLITGFIFAFVAAIIVISFWLQRERTLVANLKRPIMIISSLGKDMKFEADLLRNSGFFKIVDEPSNDLRNLDNIHKYSLLIIGYSKEGKVLSTAVQATRNFNVPIIIYANQGEIDSNGEDMDLIRGYHLAEIANSPLRLMNLIFSILSIYKSNKV